MTTVQALKDLYVKLGGTLADVAEINTVAEMIETVKTVAGGGGGLPEDFPSEGIANANKFIGFDSEGDYTAKDGGSEKYVVTLTEDNGTWTADKSISAINTAIANGANVVAHFEADGTTVELHLAGYESPDTVAFAVTSGDTVITFVGIHVSDEDRWTRVENEFLTESPVLTVVYTTTSDGQGGITVTNASETYADILSAIQAGKAVICVTTGATYITLGTAMAGSDGGGYVEAVGTVIVNGSLAARGVIHHVDDTFDVVSYPA